MVFVFEQNSILLQSLMLANVSRNATNGKTHEAGRRGQQTHQDGSTMA